MRAAATFKTRLLGQLADYCQFGGITQWQLLIFIFQQDDTVISQLAGKLMLSFHIICWRWRLWMTITLSHF